MMRARNVILAVGLLVLSAIATLRAASPAVVMIHGGRLAAPIFITVSTREDVANTLFLWGRASEGLTLANAGERDYLDVAMFWGYDVWRDALTDPAVRRQLRPADANQHGRLVLPTASESALMFVTTITGPALGMPQPERFTAGWRLSPRDTDALRALGILPSSIGNR